MSSPFVAEIRMCGFNFAPKGWATCDGQLLPISQNTALFSLLGTVYGGNGQSTFGLPDLQGSAPMFWGSGAGLTPRDLGEQSGSSIVTLLQTEIPQHTHALNAFPNPGNVNTPDPTVSLARSRGGAAYKQTPQTVVNFAFQALSPAGGSLSHNNMMPYLTVLFCIALQGVFPARG